MSDAQDSPRKRRGCWRVFKWTLLLFVIVLAVVGYILFRSVPIASLPTLARGASGGMVVATIDPADPELAALLDSLSDGHLNLRGKRAGFVGGLLRRAVDPNIVLISHYLPSADSPGDREELAAVAQFHRFLPIVYKALRRAGQQAEAAERIEVKDDYVRLVPEGGKKVALAVTRSAFIAGSDDAIVDQLVGLLRSSGDPTAAEDGNDSELSRALFERLGKSLGQVRGYFLMPEGRLADLLHMAMSRAAERGNSEEALKPEAIDFLDRSIEAIFVEGELLGGDSAELRLALLATDAQAAGLMEDVLREQVLPALRANFAEQAVNVEREGDEVALVVRITGLKELLGAGRKN